MLITSAVYGQATGKIHKGPVVTKGAASAKKMRDSLRAQVDSSFAKAARNIREKKSTALQSVKAIKTKADSFHLPRRSSVRDSFSFADKLKRKFSGITTAKLSKDNLLPKHLDSTLKAQLLKDLSFKKILFRKPLIDFGQGYLSYQFNYRSAIDTPYVERDIAQHQTNAKIDFAVGGIPFQLFYWSRYSNSTLFKDITNVQLSFNAYEFRNRLGEGMRQSMMDASTVLRDSLMEKLYFLKKDRLSNLGRELKSAATQQALVQANEVLRVPKINYNRSSSDSANLSYTDSLKKTASGLLNSHQQALKTYDSLSNEVDSLKKLYDIQTARIKRFKSLLTGKAQHLISPDQLKKMGAEYGLSESYIPEKYRWLLGIRQFNLGRSLVDHSDLTAKNLSVNGVNFEYNSWYYVAVTAGMIDYRFRDFVVTRLQKTPQYFYQLRLGIGRKEGNNFILSVYHGQKQLFAGSGLSSIKVSGISLAGRIQVNRNTFFTAEVAESISPDYRKVPVEKNTRINFSDKTDKAIALRVYSYLPKSQTRVEGLYKYTGANFQSFNSFQTSAALQSWYVKADQPFFKRRLRIAGSIRSNEFSNPFLIQQYKTNSIFKSLTATMRIRKWPIITAGYQPMSQYTVIDNQTLENTFQTINVSAYHTYRIKQLNTSTTVLYNRFFNTSADTGFIYYNSNNIYGMQQFFFSRFTAGIGASFTQNPSYRYTVLDESVQVSIGKLGSLGVGVKISNLNQEFTKLGGYLNANFIVNKKDMIYISYEKGYLPGWNKGLIRSEFASVQFTKTFDFHKRSSIK